MLVVGAGYVALECAGFLQVMHLSEQPVTILVRSMLLRGFDRYLPAVSLSHHITFITHIISYHRALPARQDKLILVHVYCSQCGSPLQQ